MNKKIVKLLMTFISILLILSISLISVSAEGYSSYQERVNQDKTYMVKQRPVFDASKSITGANLNISAFSSPSDICVQDGKIYILDGGNSRIVVLNKDYSYSHIIDNITYNNEKIELNNAKGIYVSEDSSIYIADPVGQQVLVADKKGNVKNIVTKPDSTIIPETLEFKAKKVLVDCDGYMFVLCEGVYYGAMVFDKDYQFCGFFGANQTASNLLDTLKFFISKIFQTDIKKQYSLRTLPYEFDDLYEFNGFIYTATKNSENNKGQIRKLSNSGLNTLNKDGISADEYSFGNGNEVTLIDKTVVSEKFCSVAVDGNGYIYALDATYGRVFIYDTECNLVSAFGGGMGLGEQLGSFTQASEIVINGNDVLIVDTALNSVTVFKLTDFGKLFYEAINVEKNGEYDKAFPLWKNVLASDAFNQRAYTGIANYYFANGDFKLTLEYAKKALNKDLYDQAFEEVRREFLSQNFIWLFAVIIILLGLLVVAAVRKNKVKEEAIEKDNNIFITTLTSIRHPIQTATYIKRIRTEKRNKELNIYTVVSIGLFLLMFVLKVLETTVGGFLYTNFDPNTYSSALVLIATVGVLMLWCVVNWGLCTLFEGKGTFREIVVVSGLAMIPQIVYSIFFIIASHCLVYSESAIISGANIIAWLITIVILLVMLSIIHDYSFFRAIGMSLATILGMCVAAFMILLVLTLFQDLIEFIRSVYNEIIYRGV